MALNKKPTTGMKDILPEEMRIREYVQNVISETYAKFGFTRIETPVLRISEISPVSRVEIMKSLSSRF